MTQHNITPHNITQQEFNSLLNVLIVLDRYVTVREKNWANTIM